MSDWAHTIPRLGVKLLQMKRYEGGTHSASRADLGHVA